MNDFLLFEHLCAIENILSQYKYADESRKKILSVASDIKNRVYRVAVIGEFKRGKSSLINSLIGSRVLPTDVLPMTATLTRIRYGEKKRILIEYKSGEQEEKSIDDLIEFATKFDKEKEKKS